MICSMAIQKIIDCSLDKFATDSMTGQLRLQKSIKRFSKKIQEVEALSRFNPRVLVRLHCRAPGPTENKFAIIIITPME